MHDAVVVRPLRVAFEAFRHPQRRLVVRQADGAHQRGLRCQRRVVLLPQFLPLDEPDFHAGHCVHVCGTNTKEADGGRGQCEEGAGRGSRRRHSQGRGEVKEPRHVPPFFPTRAGSLAVIPAMLLLVGVTALRWFNARLAM